LHEETRARTSERGAALCLLESGSCSEKRRKTKERETQTERESGAERQHSPHIGGSDKELGRRV